MAQEDKILLGSLCARLPYKPKIKIGKYCDYTLIGIDLSKEKPIIVELDGHSFEVSCKNVQLVLRPLSSMTEEEIKECYRLQQDTIHVTFDEYDEEYEKTIDLPYFESLVDFYNSRHLDYCSLIPEGLAVEAPKDMYN